MHINTAANEVVLKIVYYGPGMAGKTTNLTVIHDRVPSQAAGDLMMVDTHSERTLKFDLLAMDGGSINGYRIRYEFYTVPGQSYYAATRRAVLQGADAVVFVADSRREALDENIEAMNEMLGNIRHHDLPEDLPLVVQYNKQDLPTALRREQLEPLMNVRGWPSIASIAVDGEGVMETMQMITDMAVQAAENNNTAPAPDAPPSTWLISCYRCQAMLEVPEAQPGSVYACGICGSALEVVDADRGLTRAPSPSAVTAAGSGGHGTISGGNRTVSGGQRIGSGGQRIGSGGQRSVAEDSVYGMQAIPGQANNGGLSAVAPDSRSGSVTSTPFEVPGYDVVGLIDESAQGRRVRVRERSTGRTLRALVLNPALMRQPGFADNLEPHVRLAGQVKHPYILPLAAMTPTQDSMVLFSADPQDYEPLGHVLARRRALAPPHAMGILRQVVLALEEAARHGVVHGWLRPEVILVSADGNVVVDEFGVLKNHRFLVRELSGASAATEYYLAPEHLSGDVRSDARSDIFMLGALLFRMMTGEGLVTGYNAHEALHKVVANGARTLRSIQPGVSRDLDLFCQNMVASERKDRMQSYREVLDQLDKFGGGAKRQTLRLTQNVVAGGGTSQLRRTGTGQLRRTGTGQLRRAGTGQIPRNITSNTATHKRHSPGSGERLVPRPRQPASSNAGMGILIVVMVVVVAVIAYLLFGNQFGRTKPAADPQASQNPPATNSTNTTTTTQNPPPNTNPAKTPTWMEKNDPPKTPPTPPNTTPPPQPPPPTVDQTPPANTPPTTPPLAEEDRVSLLLAIAELERAGRYKDALAKCEQLPSVEERQSRILQVANNHAFRRKEVSGEVILATDIAHVESLLKPALETWGMPDDEKWAAEQLAEAKKRLGSKVTTTNTNKPTAPTVEQAPVSNAVTIDHQINKALANGQLALANQSFNALQTGSQEAVANRRKIDLFNARGDILGRILKERSPKLRVLHPTTNEQWDVVGVIDGGLVVASAAGSKTDLTWNQVSIKDIARIFLEASAHPATKPDEFVLTTIMQLIAGETVMASVTLKRSKGIIDPAAGKDLEILINLQRQGEVLQLADVGKEAAAAGNTKVVADTIEQIKKLDPALQALVVDDLAKLENALKAPSPTTGNSGAASASKDHVLFEVNEDLKTFTEKTGTWLIANGMAGNTTDTARLHRKDLEDARGVHFLFMPMASKGQLRIDFRGVGLVIDFASNSFQALSREETKPAKKFSFLPKASCSILFELRQPGNQVNIVINNGAESVAVKGGNITDNFTVQCDRSNIAIDELQILRGRPATNKVEQGELRKLGLEPLGEAVLEAPAIVLPESRGVQSGVAIALRDNIAGATFEAKGSGLIRLQLGNPNDRSGQWIDVPVGAVPAIYRVTWLQNNLLVTDASGTQIGNVQLKAKYTHFMIIATKEATLLATPRLTYQ